MKNPILELSFAFALKIVAYCELLEKQKKFIIANQLLKSGTSIGANIREAQNPHRRHRVGKNQRRARHAQRLYHHRRDG